ncbi:MAG: ABC transporter ATP-binding protein [Haloarculaceae archaeon]
MSSTDQAVTDEAVLRTEGLTRMFGELVAVDEVDISVREGELRSVIGPNGAGKTTTFNCITGVLPPSEGSVYFHDEDITDVPEESRPHLGLARSFQSNQLFADETVLENVRIAVQTEAMGTFSFKILVDGRDYREDRAYELLDLLGLRAVADTQAKNLSHGDQRRLGIAMALATKPDVLLLDEPTSGMSPSATAETAQLIEDIQDDLGLTLVLIEHDMDVVLSISDRITVLHRGAELATGSPAEIQDNEEVQDAYLGGLKEEIDV